ncbi:MAG: hypothetical protein IM466_04435 [Microcystis sp. M04BS1]|uniref:Uncharacterized protein n=1 Tax=Microcystis aeruginosa Ma_MB_S_20031200_S102 TaxID=2486254 RepID=A0A552ENA5_MICAE|nr:hypothetical protein [Microcystis aeruginosa]MCA2552996.1 hypothetical protein [Microcystis sp. M04BS1]NCS23410.1 hypothetical protein [Microcystis aeruginosa BS13-02]TRU23741.1 MAG: hypothetical protein EWV79_11495 [Microcystis aeruginosa Ma_MB_S_20031200_S102D]TRU35950.1 MAG: hypothetical protein EWV92_13065 [Microcystis aeruginosa Ma_MB_S_20031200_S102]MDB9507352.1 hypothetical protein [Microcystis aeruginosa CS-338/01]
MVSINLSIPLKEYNFRNRSGRGQAAKRGQKGHSKSWISPLSHQGCAQVVCQTSIQSTTLYEMVMRSLIADSTA